MNRELTLEAWEQLRERFGGFHDAEICSIHLAKSQGDEGYDATISLRAIEGLNGEAQIDLTITQLTRALFGFDSNSDYSCVRFEIGAIWQNGLVYLELGDCPEPEPSIDDFLQSDKLVVGRSLYVLAQHA